MRFKSISFLLLTTAGLLSKLVSCSTPRSDQEYRNITAIRARPYSSDSDETELQPANRRRMDGPLDSENVSALPAPVQVDDPLREMQISDDIFVMSMDTPVVQSPPAVQEALHDEIPIAHPHSLVRQNALPNGLSSSSDLNRYSDPSLNQLSSFRRIDSAPFPFINSDGSLHNSQAQVTGSVLGISSRTQDAQASQEIPSWDIGFQTTSNDSSQLLFSRLMDLPKKKKKPLPVVFNFDMSEPIFFPYVASASIAVPYQTETHYGQFVDPETGSSRYVQFPLSTAFHRNIYPEDPEDVDVDADVDENANSHDEEEPTQIDVDDDATYMSQPSVIHVNNPIYETPERERPQNLFCPWAPRPGYDDEQCDQGNDYEYDSPKEGHELVKPVTDCKCTAAEMKFERLVALIADVPQVHLDLEGQDRIFSSNGLQSSYFKDSSLLTINHLKAFELDFESFYRLVRSCPTKYFLPALALSLQYDQDFPKFFELYFGLKNLFGIEYDPEYQHLFIDLFLRMPRVSFAVFEFFSSSKNAMFFFSTFQSDPFYYGKFSMNTLASAISEQLTSQPVNQDEIYQNNPMRNWLLNFNYFEFINANYKSLKFAETNLVAIMSSISIFQTESEYFASVYKVFMTLSATENRQYWIDLIYRNNKIRVLFREAFRNGNSDLIRDLFLSFRLERNERYPLEKRTVSLEEISFSITPTAPHNSLCIIRITESSYKVSLILPFNQ